MSNRNLVVLVVEDNLVILMGAVDSVVVAGFEALGAGSADEAIRILEGRPDIHLVFTDVGMPGTMDGITVDESHLPAGARFFPKPYNECAIVEAMMGMLSEANCTDPQKF